MKEQILTGSLKLIFININFYNDHLVTNPYLHKNVLEVSEGGYIGVPPDLWKDSKMWDILLTPNSE